MRRSTIALALVATLASSYPVGVHVAAPLFDSLGTERIAGTPVAEPSEDDPGWNCQRHGNRRCGPAGPAPGGRLPFPGFPGPTFETIK